MPRTAGILPPGTDLVRGDSTASSSSCPERRPNLRARVVNRPRTKTLLQDTRPPSSQPVQPARPANLWLGPRVQSTPFSGNKFLSGRRDLLCLQPWPAPAPTTTVTTAPPLQHHCPSGARPSRDAYMHTSSRLAMMHPRLLHNSGRAAGTGSTRSIVTAAVYQRQPARAQNRLKEQLLLAVVVLPRGCAAPVLGAMRWENARLQKPMPVALGTCWRVSGHGPASSASATTTTITTTPHVACRRHPSRALRICTQMTAVTE